MPTTLHFMDSPSREFRDEVTDAELCRLRLTGVRGGLLVQTEGLITGPGSEVEATLTLTVRKFQGIVLVSRRAKLKVVSEIQTFSLSLAADIPYEGGGASAGAPVPEEPSIALTVTLLGPALAYDPPPGADPHVLLFEPRVRIQGAQILALSVDEIVEH